MATKKKRAKSVKRAKRSPKKRTTSKSRKPSGLKLPRELWTMSADQIKATIAALARLPESEIRTRQDLNTSGAETAYRGLGMSQDQRNRALGNTQAMDLLLRAALFKQDGEEPVVSFAKLRAFYGGAAPSESSVPAKELDEFLRHYIIAALWSSNDNSDDSGGSPLDDNYDASDIAPACLSQMRKDCESFLEDNQKLLQGESFGYGGRYNLERAGHDFWLTRNRHGAGFWDRDELTKEQRDGLTKAAHDFGSVDLYVGNDGKIHC